MSSPEKHEFKAEIKKLLQILSKSLYQHKEIFLRELISNSSDALKRIHFISLQNRDIESVDVPLKIEVFFDAKYKTITVSDTGIGMTKDELIDGLGTIASSGSQKFLETLKKTQQEKDKPIDLDIIGQFGVGFYSVFMIADKVKVISKSYLKDQPANSWESDGVGDFTVLPADKKERGTDIILFLQADETEYLNQNRIEEIIKKYSNFISFPIFVTEIKEKVEEEKKEGKEKKEGEEKKEEAPKPEGEEKKEEPKKEEPKPVNQIEPIWRRTPSEVKEEEYKSFYKFICRRWDEYQHVVHYNVDGQVQFRSILYIPQTKSQDLLRPEVEYGPDLYTKNVMIMQNAKEFFPQWMRFVKGVVESDDIPLNISRETIQTNRLIMKMEKLLVTKVINEISALAEKDLDKFKKVWNEFGIFIKEGIITDHNRHEELTKLLRFKTTKTKEDEMIGLEQYIKNMPSDQKDIYYLVGENLNTMKISPHLGYYSNKGYEVILLPDRIDNFLMMNLRDYKTKIGEGDKAEEKTYPYKSIDEAERTEKKEKESKEKKEEKKEEKEEKIVLKPETQKFVDHVKTILGNKVEDVKVSDKLFGNPCRLATPSGGMTSTMQRAMRYWTQVESGKDFQVPRKIFELDEAHPIFSGLIKLYNENPNSGRIKPIVLQLFEGCLLSEGDLPNPSLVVPRINQILEMFISGKDDVPEPEILKEKPPESMPPEPDNLGEDLGKSEVNLDEEETKEAPKETKESKSQDPKEATKEIKETPKETKKTPKETKEPPKESKKSKVKESKKK